jgi:hypothetical protein
MMQDLIVGGAVVTAVSAAIVNGLKPNESTMCDLCKGLGTSYSTLPTGDCLTGLFI